MPHDNDLDLTAKDISCLSSADAIAGFLTTLGTPKDVLRMAKRGCKKAELPEKLTCHMFQAKMITDLLDSGASPNEVLHLSGHADPWVIKLNDRRNWEVMSNIVERLSI